MEQYIVLEEERKELEEQRRKEREARKQKEEFKIRCEEMAQQAQAVVASMTPEEKARLLAKYGYA